MAAYVELSKVRLWYHDVGGGEPLVLLHGGAVDSSFFAPNIDALAERFHVFAVDLRGHGHTPDVAGPFTYDALAQDMTEFVDAVVGGPAHLVGHSIGAAVLLHAALRRPDLVRGLVLMSGVFHHDGQIGTDEIDVDEVVAALGGAYGAVSPDGEDHYPVIVRKEVEMDQREPTLTPPDLARIGARTLVMASDDDIIHLEHTLALYRGIEQAELAIIPGTSHFMTQEKPDLCNAIVIDFLTKDPLATVAPVRRAPSHSSASTGKSIE
jgi:pimeloyl-ACP methyl ester carboxylesterase